VSCDDDDTVLCQGRCVNTRQDVENCGACGQRCPPVPNGTQECNGGRCRVRCNSGFSDCSGACVDTKTDPAHCGSCGRACSGLCVLGQCLLGL
jgi:hypothetical protein